MITLERKLELRKAAAQEARTAVERHACSLYDVHDAEEAAYMQRYMNVLAKKINHTVFVDEAEL